MRPNKLTGALVTPAAVAVLAAVLGRDDAPGSTVTDRSAGSATTYHRLGHDLFRHGGCRPWTTT
jgi:hypothetical protein